MLLSLFYYLLQDSYQKKWDKNYINFDIAIKKFQSLNLQLVDIMVFYNEKLKQKLIDKILIDQKNNF